MTRRSPQGFLWIEELQNVFYNQKTSSRRKRYSKVLQCPKESQNIFYDKIASEIPSLTRNPVEGLQGLEELHKDFYDQKIFERTFMTRKSLERLLWPEDRQNVVYDPKNYKRSSMTRKPLEDLLWPEDHHTDFYDQKIHKRSSKTRRPKNSPSRTRKSPKGVQRPEDLQRVLYIQETSEGPLGSPQDLL